MQMIGGSDALMRGGKLDGGLQTTLRRLLFGTSNATGFTFEPWDMTTLYQDRAGTTPVTAVGQSVGLRLSKDKGLRVGPELVTNGDFASGAIGWTLGTDWSISGGFASRGANVTASNLTGGSGVEAGKTYRVTWTQGAEAVAVYLGGAAGPLVSNTSAAGTYSRLILATVTGGIVFRASASVSSIDNISVRELAGNHEVAINDAARGVYGREPETGTRNRFIETEFRNGVTDASPRGGLISATTLTGYAGALAFGRDGVTSTYAYKQLAVTTGVTYTISAVVEMTDGLGPPVFSATTALNDFALIMESNAQPAANHVTTALGGGLYRVSASKVSATTGTTNFGVVKNAAYSARTFKATAYQIEVGSLSAYQKVNTLYDVTEAGVASCYYVQTDGVDDAYVTPTITPGTDKAQVFMALKKIGTGDTAQIIAEMSVTREANNGAFTVGVPGSVAGLGAFLVSRGTVDATAQVTTGYTPPTHVVLTGLTDISGDVATLRVNGSQIAQAVTDQGTGNFLAYPAYLYARGGTTQPAAVRDYGHAVRFGPNLDAATIARVEALIARNTPEVTL